jgi:hypothetical protein
VLRERGFAGRGVLAGVIMFGLALGGCESVPGLPPNPFRMPPTFVADLPPTPTRVVVVPTETPVSFKPYWAKNHRQTEMWSGQVGEPGVVSFGKTSDQFCLFQVLLPQEGSRVFVLNPFGRGEFWIEADAIGPVAEEPQRVRGPKPVDQNCAGVIYDTP